MRVENGNKEVYRMTIRRYRFVLALVLAVGIASLSPAQEVQGALEAGLREFQAGDFAAALEQFRIAADASESDEEQFAGYAEFWVARSLMALEQFARAADAFDLFLAGYPDHVYREEAAYQRARLFYLSGEYEAAIQRFDVFLADYAGSDFTANALYWTGESLFALGKLEEARRFFEEVTERYPTSYRVEAARYRQNVIDLKLRENELLTLLQWSHEEYLSALEEFRQKEIAYQDALASYRDRLGTLAAEDFQEEIRLLGERIAELETAVADRDAQINELRAQLRQAQTAEPEVSRVSPDEPAVEEEIAAEESNATDVRAELLSLKAAALELQQRLMEQGAE
jgi:TolA-binding protein